MTNTDAKIMREAGISEDDDADYFGRTGEKSQCYCCEGRGTYWSETCFVCAGYGWTREEETLS